MIKRVSTEKGRLGVILGVSVQGGYRVHVAHAK